MCLFHSIRRLLDCPKEYTSTHLKRQIIAHIANNVEHYMNDQGFIESLRGTYGWDGQGFSLVTYLEQLLNPDAWGDEICLSVISHMWGVSITLVYPMEGNREYRIRHSQSLESCDMPLLYTGQSHYSPIGKLSTPYFGVDGRVVRVVAKSAKVVRSVIFRS